MRNRLWLAPMTNLQSHADGALSDDELHWLQMRADGGFAVIETCAAHVALDGQGWPGELGIYDDKLLPGLRRLATMFATREVLGLVQLYHGGLRAPEAVTGQLPWTATAVNDGALVARAATESDLIRALQAFRDAAVRAHSAGFGGVELHGAHGYLLGQFLSATLNTRDDAWGGDLVGRARFVREAMRAVRSAVPASFVVGIRLSPEDFGNARGIDLDEAIQVARWMADDGADFIHVSLWDSKRNTRKRPDEHAIPLFRAALPSDVTLVAAGSIWTRDDAQSLIDKGATAVAVGRAAIANPQWASQLKDPDWQPRRPPMTIAELVERGLSPTFANYMRGWKNFVAD